MSSILSIGQTALSAAQAGLATTSNNIANAQTPGYSREVVFQTAAFAQNSGAGSVGSGVTVSDVRRSYDALLSTQWQSALSTQGASAAYHAQVTRLDDALGNNAGGVAPAMQGFFAAMQTMATQPQSAATRQGLLSAGSALSTSIRSLGAQLDGSRADVNSQITRGAAAVTSLARQIAGLNDAIVRAGTREQMPNGLLDQRDQAVAELSKQVRVSVVPGDSGYNVFLGNGQPLVVGATASSVETVPAATDGTRLELQLRTGGHVVALPESSITGGAIGGVLEYRRKTLDLAVNSLGRIALVLADSVNAQHHLGIDQDGNPGGDFFTTAAPAVSASATNGSAAVAGASVVTPSALTASDYLLQYDGAGYSVKQLATGQVTTLTSMPQTVDGISFGMVSGTPVKGDSFLIQPTRNAAASLQVALTNTRQVAAATPVVGGSALGNAGTGAIAAVSVDATYVALTGPVALTFASGGAPGVGVLSGFPDGSTAAVGPGVTVSYHGLKFEVSGAPSNGDVFTLAPNGPNSGDNGNALALAGLQSGALVAGVGLQGAFASLVGAVGAKAQELKTTSGADDTIAATAQAAVENNAGVNLDEEAANLLKYQQAYQAAGKVMATANQMFTTLMSLFPN